MASDQGIVVKTSDPLTLRAKLYPLRAKDDFFKSLALVLSPTSPKDELWIVKQGTENAEPKP